MEPVTALTAAAIVQLAFSEFIKSGVGELAKQSIGGTADLVKSLRERIREKFGVNNRAVTALAQVEEDGNEEALAKLTKYLDIEMVKDEQFANEIRQIVQQIFNIQNQSSTTLNQQNINHGRDQFIVNQPQGNINLGG
jgi:hypothetical protein